ncbi:MAG TPA: hypothetical protein VFP94_05865 [Terriglobales bacterium]|nr:hypothetical protein [Terriglobales bacterium]
MNLANTASCRALRAGYDGDLFGLQWSLSERHLLVRLDPKLGLISGNLPVPLLNGLQALHTTLEQASVHGCLTPAAVGEVLRKAVEAVPLAPDLAQQMQFGPYALRDYVDIGGPIELAFTYALTPGQPNRYDLGYVERMYRLHPDVADGRGHLLLASSAVKSATAHGRLPRPPLAMPDGGIWFFRLFFDLRRSPSDHSVALVWASSPATLVAASEGILSRPDRCDNWDLAGSGCVAAPRWVGLEARVRVKVEGRWEGVPLPATVEMALHTAGAPTDPRRLKRLRVLRPYRGRETAVISGGGPAILLQLTLDGGEEISWQ